MIGPQPVKVCENGPVPDTAPPVQPPLTVTVAVEGANWATSVGAVLVVMNVGPVKLAMLGCVTCAVAVFVAEIPAWFVTDIVTVALTVGFDVRCAVKGPVTAPVSMIIGGLNETVHPPHPCPLKFA